MNALIVLLVAVAVFQLVAYRIDNKAKQPEFTRLLFAPGMTGERGL